MTPDEIRVEAARDAAIIMAGIMAGASRTVSSSGGGRIYFDKIAAEIEAYIRGGKSTFWIER